MTSCLVCPTYSADVNLRIDRAGRNHREAIRTIKSVEANPSPSRAVVMGHTIGIAPALTREAELTAVALGFTS